MDRDTKVEEPTISTQSSTSASVDTDVSTSGLAPSNAPIFSNANHQQPITCAVTSDDANANNLLLATLPAEVRMEIYASVFREVGEVKINTYKLTCVCPLTSIYPRKATCKCHRHETNLVNTTGCELLFVCRHIYREASAIFLREAKFVCCCKPLVPSPVRFRYFAENQLRELSISLDVVNVNRGFPSWDLRPFKALKTIRWAIGDVCVGTADANHTNIGDRAIIDQFPILKKWPNGPPPPRTINVICHFNVWVYTLRAGSTWRKWRYRYQALPCTLDFHTRAVTRYPADSITGRYLSQAEGQDASCKNLASHIKNQMSKT